MTFAARWNLRVRPSRTSEGGISAAVWPAAAMQHHGIVRERPARVADDSCRLRDVRPACPPAVWVRRQSGGYARPLSVGRIEQALQRFAERVDRVRAEPFPPALLDHAKTAPIAVLCPQALRGEASQFGSALGRIGLDHNAAMPAQESDRGADRLLGYASEPRQVPDADAVVGEDPERVAADR